MYIVIDIETGGFSKDKNGICQIGALKVDAELNIVDEFDVLIYPYKRKDSDELVSYKEDAVKVHGIEEHDLIEAGIDAEEVIDMLEEFVEGSEYYIGHNLKSFDLPWIRSFFERFNKVLDEKEIIDTLKLARYMRGTKDDKGGKIKNSLPALCEAYGIDNETAHDALSDCKATLEVYKILK